MSRRKHKKRYVSKHEKDSILITSTIIKIEQQNEIIGEKFKNVFYLKSKNYPETGRMCVLWGRINFNVGDEITAKGRLNTDGVFLVWSFLITRRSVSSQGSSPCPSTPIAVKRAGKSEV